MNYEDLFTDEELNELNNYEYDEEHKIDEAIERIDNYEQEKERLREIYEQRVEALRQSFKEKEEKIQKKIDWEQDNIKKFVLNSPNLKTTKTKYKLDFVSGTVEIKKPEIKIKKPEVKKGNLEEMMEKLGKDNFKEVVEYNLDWKNLKNMLVIDEENKKVINNKTGQDLSDAIEIEEVPEQIEIKKGK